MENSIQILKNFAEGRITTKDFENSLYYDENLQKLLSDSQIDYRSMPLGGYINAYDYLIQLNYNDAGDRLNAHDIICRFLKEIEIEYKPTKIYDNFNDLISDCQPGYLDMDAVFFEKYIWQSDYETLNKRDKIKKLKEKINQYFRYHKKPPKWIQNPNWPIQEEKPLYFLGQYKIEDCEFFHDDGFVYLFLDFDKGEIKTITQFY